MKNENFTYLSTVKKISGSAGALRACFHVFLDNTAKHFIQEKFETTDLSRLQFAGVGDPGRVNVPVPAASANVKPVKSASVSSISAPIG